MSDTTHGTCNGCRRRFPLTKLDGAPETPTTVDFNLLFCKDCYGVREYKQGDELFVLTFNEMESDDGKADRK